MANPGMSNRKVFVKAGVTQKIGVDCLKKTSVKIALKEWRAQVALDTQISLKRVMLEETCIAYYDPVDLFTKEGTMLSPDQLPERIRRAISSIEVIELPSRNGDVKQYKYKYRFWDKGKSLERISKHLGLYEKDNLQKAVRMYFLRADDEAVPKIENSPDFIEAEFTKLKGDKPIALLE